MRFVDPDADIVKSVNLPLVPMIDVFMNLLIFFLVGGHFKIIERQLETDLPKLAAPNKAIDQTILQELWVRLRNTGTAANPKPLILVDTKGYTTWEGVEAALTAQSRLPGALKNPVIVSPEPTAEHGWVMHVLGILNQLNFKEISFRR